MTVEIIAPADPEKMYIKDCENCGVKLRYVKNDIYSHTVTDYGGGIDTYHMIRCPECFYLNDVKERPLVTNKWKGDIVDGRGYLPDEAITNE